MDSGYPNSSSPPDLSPESDLSSIAHDRSSSESPSLAYDGPRNDFVDFDDYDFATEVAENRDLANNNLDDEGNNVEAAVDLCSFVDALLENNDWANKNNTYVARGDGLYVDEFVQLLFEKIRRRLDNFFRARARRGRGGGSKKKHKTQVFNPQFIRFSHRITCFRCDPDQSASFTVLLPLSLSSTRL